MSIFLRCAAVAALVVALGVSSVSAVEITAGMKTGAVELKSAGPLAFGPEGVLFVSDPIGASVTAIATGDREARDTMADLQVEKLDAKIASLLGTEAKQIQIVDLAVNPISKKIYLSVSRGQGPAAKTVILTVDASGKVQELDLSNVKHSQTVFSNAPSPDAKDRRGNSQRLESITDLAYVDGKVYVTGLSNEEFASKFRALSFPFSAEDKGVSIEIYHGSHGGFETRAPVRTFVPFTIGKEQTLLAAYTCTPLVKFPVAQLKSGSKVQGTTVAELGNYNRPLDMIVYNKGGKDYLLLANSARGVMKIAADQLTNAKPITERIPDKAGVGYETIEGLKGVEQLDRLDKEHAILLVKSEAGISLTSVNLP